MTALIPAALAGYELRYILVWAWHALAALGELSRAHPGTGWLFLTVLVLGMGAMLREVGRGVGAAALRPRFSPGFLGLWLLGSTGAMAMLCGPAVWHALPGAAHPLVASGHPVGWAWTVHVLGAGAWSAAPAALFAGFLFAAYVRCARWALRTVARWCAPLLTPTPAAPSGGFGAPLLTPLRSAPVADGWSSRGPPVLAAAAVSVS